MLYHSTRGGGGSVSASEAILMGIAEDGGLFVPDSFPVFPLSLEAAAQMTYQELTYQVLSLYLTDYSEDELRACIRNAYGDAFDTPLIAPLKAVGDSFFLELFHGPTLAFKDMALSILPYLMKTAAAKSSKARDILILTATSGDTGKAALEGFAGVEGIKIVVFYPDGGVSPVQKQQMVTQEGDNTAVIAIRGNFDDTQNGVKKLFGDPSFNQALQSQGYRLSSANSINIGRLLPQVVYYFYAYAQMLRGGYLKPGDTLNVTVPTGNFGNILAAYYAKRMGLPLGTLICASNDNKVLYDFFQTGEYDKNRPFVLTISPSMDILISSNLERLLYHVSNSAAQTQVYMELLGRDGKYRIDDLTDEFAAEYATEGETKAAIRACYDKCGYVMDPHTAVAYAACEKFKQKAGSKEQTQGKNVIVSTASPFKFTEAVCGALDESCIGKDAFALLAVLEDKAGVPLPLPLKDIQSKPVRHTAVYNASDMQKAVEDALTRMM